MAENPDLTFEPVADDDLLVARMRASYRALPAPSAGQIERCTRDVLASVAAGATEVSVAGTPGPGRRAARRRAVASARNEWWAWPLRHAGGDTVMRPGAARKTRNADSAFAAGAAAVLPVGSTRDEGGGEIRFDLTPPPARAVAIVSDFNGWDETKTPMA